VRQGLRTPTGPARQPTWTRRTATGASAPAGRTAATRDIRRDVEGLRAVAVGLVLLWHAGIPFVPGGFVGVDVFFVISGFLITGIIVTEIERTGRLSLVGFYAKRAKRLLPAAAVVLTSTLALTYFFIPKIRWAETSFDIAASALYVMNWRLADKSVDYLASDQAPSVVQHFWSLAVEEQFYLVWPPLILLVTILMRRRQSGRPRRGPLLVAIAMIAVPSLAWSVYLSGVNPGQAYFVSTTRLWELALGGCLAILSVHLDRIPRFAAILLGWAGLSAIAASAILLNTATPFPGYHALMPTLGAAAVIAAGASAGKLGPVLLLGRPPMQVVGALSYSLYLWHWPLLVVGTAVVDELTTIDATLIVIFAALPAYLTHRFVENPLRFAVSLNRQPSNSLSLGALCTALPIVAAMVFHLTLWSGSSGRQPGPAVNADQLLASPGVRKIGAAVLAETPRGDTKGAPTDRVESITPDPLVARQDVPALYRDGCQVGINESTPKSCVYGDSTGDFTVALVGDSHAAQWAPALESIARNSRWRLVTYTKSACPFLLDEVLHSGRAYRTCTEWNALVREQLTGDKRPDLVVVSNSSYRIVRNGNPLSAEASQPALVDAMRETWAALGSAGLRTVVLRNSPHPGIDIAECASKHADRLSACAVDRQPALSGVGPGQVTAAAGLTNVHLVDLNDAICPTDQCSAVIGNVLVYRDTNHLTATYVRTLTPRLNTELNKILDQ